MKSLTGRAFGLALAIAALALAGCVGSDTSSASERVSTGETSLPTTGSLSQTSAENATDEVEPPQPLSVNVTYDAETGTFVCGMAVVTGTCQGQFSAAAMRPLEYQGSPLRFTGALSWTPTLPTANEMEILILIKNGSAFEWRDDLPSASGPPPLSFDFDLAHLDGLELWVDVNSMNWHGAPGVAGAGGSVKQAFHFEGALTYLPRMR